MSDPNQLPPDLRSLMSAACDDALAPHGVARLESCCSDETSVRMLVDYLQLDAELSIVLKGEEALDRALQAIGTAGREMQGVGSGQWPAASESENGNLRSEILAPLSSLPSPFSTYFTSGWPVAYLVATVIFGVGLLVGSILHVSRPEQLVGTDSRSGGSPAASRDESNRAVVGRITGEVECRWKRSGFRVQSSGGKEGDFRSQVRLGDTLAIHSGLAEITYKSGAKVILQGPVTYEVESPTGGYLSVGKLTAKLEKRSAVSGQRSETSNPQSLIPNPLFSVRTPTAIVTDLGTEFGVEVGQGGVTRVHVLQGLVEARGTGKEAEHGHCERLAAGKAVEIGQAGKSIKAVSFAPETFVRTLPSRTESRAETAYIDAVLADKPLAYWPLNEPRGSRTFADRSGHGFHGYAVGKPAAGEPGALGAGSRAVGFDGGSYIDALRHDEFAFQNNFSIEAWMCVSGEWPQQAARIISANPDTSWKRKHGWGFEATDLQDRGDESAAILRFSAHPAKDYEFPMPPRKPVHYAEMDSSRFPWRYDMNTLPTKVDFDGDGVVDFERRGGGSIEVADGVLNTATTSDGYLMSGNLWTGRFAKSEGYTVEARMRVVSQDMTMPVAGAFGIDVGVAGSPAAELAIASERVVWIGRPGNLAARRALGGAADNTNDYHTYRISQVAGTDTFLVWRDNVRLTPTAIAGCQPILDRLYFVDGGGNFAGVCKCDYVRFTPGTYAPAGEIVPGAGAETAAAGEEHWVHVAFVCEPDYTGYLYLNGRRQGTVGADKPGAQGPVWVEIGGSRTYGEYWHGRLAHIAVYPRALSRQQIEGHYRQAHSEAGAKSE
jgi:hypothetical protein